MIFFPENTSLAFFEAAKIPVYKGMETDVAMTKDGVLVCMHDRKLDRTTNGTDSLSKYTMKELQELWIDGGYGWNEKYKETLRIPTFETSEPAPSTMADAVMIPRAKIFIAIDFFE